jgi:hypothetical protein
MGWRKSCHNIVRKEQTNIITIIQKSHSDLLCQTRRRQTRIKDIFRLYIYCSELRYFWRVSALLNVLRNSWNLIRFSPSRKDQFGQINGQLLGISFIRTMENQST